jgi:Family of unknown function (DUF6282)
MKMSQDRELMRGAIDCHCHTAPAIFPRLMDDADLARIAIDYGMRAVVLKDHDMITTGRAYYVNRMFPGVQTIGTVILNRSVGGLNPYVVESGIQYGARLIFMPTNHARWHQEYYGNSNYPGLVRPKQLPGQGITILDENKKVKPEVGAILDLIASSDVCLGTGHLSHEETFALVDEAAKRGVAKILVTHGNWSLCKYSLEEQKRLMAKGAYIEYVVLTLLSPVFHEQSITEFAEWIMAFKGERLVLSSDLGQMYGPPHPEGIRMGIAGLLGAGVPYEYLEKMAKVNPAKLLGLSE